MTVIENYPYVPAIITVFGWLFVFGVFKRINRFAAHVNVAIDLASTWYTAELAVWTVNDGISYTRYEYLHDKIREAYAVTTALKLWVNPEDIIPLVDLYMMDRPMQHRLDGVFLYGPPPTSYESALLQSVKGI
jgi:hypothetical protein